MSKGARDTKKMANSANRTGARRKLAAMITQPEVRLSGALVAAALADEATAALPDGGLKAFLRMLQAATGAYASNPPEFVVRYPILGEGHPWESAERFEPCDDEDDLSSPARPA